MITITGNGTKHIYSYKFKEYLNKVTEILEPRYNYSLNTIIEINEDKETGMISFTVSIYDHYLEIINGKVHNKKLSNPRILKSNKYKISSPIEIELSIVCLLISGMYDVFVDADVHQVLNLVDLFLQEPIYSPWTLDLKSFDSAYLELTGVSVSWSDKLRHVLKQFIPTYSANINALKQNAFIVNDTDLRFKLIEHISNEAVDEVLSYAETDHGLCFNGIDQFEIKVEPIGSMAANLVMNIDIADEDFATYDARITHASFSAKYTRNITKATEIPDPSNAIAELLLNLFVWYKTSIEGQSTIEDYELFSFKDSIMQVLPVYI